jgi:hypothetical protein
MDNPTKCAAINNKLVFTKTYPENIETGTALSVAQVNPTPPTTFHIQNCYRDSGLAIGQYFILDNQTNPQYTTPPPMNTPMRWRVITNSTAPVGISVELTLVNSSNNEEKVTLATNGNTSVFTPLSIYKNCNDIRITSAHQLLSTDTVIALPDSATSANNIRCVLSALYKYNGLFMCCNAADGTPRRARLVGLPQIYSAVATNYRLYKWPNSNSGPTTGTPIYSVIYVDSTVSTAPGFKRRVQTPIDGQVELLPGEACAWWRSANSNALATVTAMWEYYNTTS